MFATLVQEYPGHLRRTDACEEEVDRGETV